jgi:ketosteroid isomerase-like protein
MRQPLLILAAAVAACGCATLPVGSPDATAEAQAAAEMRAALRASADRWNAGDLKGHLAIYDESVTVMTRAGPRPTIAAIETSFAAAYFHEGKPKQSLGFDQTAIRFLSPGSALMTGHFTLVGGGLPEQAGWFSLVWVRTPSGWRVVHDHTS